jgi:hypothetical protein
MQSSQSKINTMACVVLFGGALMRMTQISRDELKEIMKEAVTTVLTERKDLLEDAVSESILDMKLALAMEEADTGEHVSEESVLSKLRV